MSVPAAEDWPLFGWVSDIRPRLAEAAAAGRPVALATLYRAAGSSPRPEGTQMLIEPDRLTGYLSGGCLEADVAAHGRAVLAEGRPRRLVYGEGSPFQDIRLLCGGRLEVLVERIAPDEPAVRRLLEIHAARTPALWSSDGEVRSCREAKPESQAVHVQGGPFRIDLRVDPAPRLVVGGGDPIALAIVQLGVLQGFETFLLRPKGPEAPPFPGVSYCRDDIPEALDRIGLDRWTAVAAASHELETDHPLLATALRSEAAYVGVLGARRRVPERLVRLRQAGVSEPALARLRAPIGMDIGARAPFEIAVAVHAEIVACWRAGEAAAPEAELRTAAG